VFYHSWICSGKSSASASAAGEPWMTFDLSHWARVTKMARPLPSGGRFFLSRSMPPFQNLICALSEFKRGFFRAHPLVFGHGLDQAGFKPVSGHRH
jgi:hypothetical protein